MHRSSVPHVYPEMRSGPQMKHCPTSLVAVCCAFTFCAAGGCDSTPPAPLPGPSAGTQPTGQAVLGPLKLKEDLDYLFGTIEQAHPNMYAYISKDEFAKVRHRTYEAAKHGMTKQEFY